MANGKALFEDIWRVLAFVAILAFLLFDPVGIVAQETTGQTSPPPAATTPDTGTPPEGSPYGELFDLLVEIFILAVLIEVGLAVLFQWRVFLRFFEGRGWKVPIAFGVSLAVVLAHGIDLPGEVVTVLDGESTGGKEVGYLVSALIIAGGSSSVNSVFASLGWRNPLAAREKAEQEQQASQGRLWVKVIRPANATSQNQPVIVKLDGTAVGTIPPGEDLFGGSKGHLASPGRRTVEAAWTDQAGGSHDAQQEVALVKGTPVTVSLTLS